MVLEAKRKDHQEYSRKARNTSHLPSNEPNHSMLEFSHLYQLPFGVKELLKLMGSTDWLPSSLASQPYFYFLFFY